MAAHRPVSAPSAASLPGPVRVACIGADGDGVAEGPGGRPLYLANTLPGELVQPGRLTKRGDGFTADGEILEASPERIPPPCPHFGPCGGCTLQHWRDDAYAAWKATRAAARLGLPPPALARSPPASRRRMDLGIVREGTTVRIGLHRRRSPDVVDMHACSVLHPTLFALVQALRPVLARLDGLRQRGEAAVNLLDSGPDLLLRTDAALSANDRAALAETARAQRMPRISWSLLGQKGAEPAAVLGPATVDLSGWLTEAPPGAFLQASREGEQAIVAAVLAALPAKLRGGIVELFAGSGTLTHALSTRARVTAYEGDPSAVTALRRAANPRVTAAVRDLSRQPLQAAELRGAAAIVLDPPYAGAAAQMVGLAATGVPIIYVSCSPAALARDSRVLTTAGYRPATIAAIDQFLWSSQVETVASFVRV